MKRLSLILFAACMAASAAALAATTSRGPVSQPAVVPVTAEDASTLYEQITRQYLAAEWETLSNDLLKRTRVIAAMSKEQQADVTYIRQAVTDGRPAWWNQVKAGKKQQISTRMWGASVTGIWDPDAKGLQVTTSAGGAKAIIFSWPAADMDAPALAEHGFTKGDLAYTTVWSTLETSGIYGQFTFQKLNAMSDADRTALYRYIGYRGMAAAAFYGTPRARRWAAFLSMDAYLGDHVNAEAFIQRKPFGAMIVQEIVGHSWKYPSFRVPRNVNGQNPEGSLATTLMSQMERVTPTFAEDKALREAVKEFVGMNGMGVVTNGKAMLPNRLTMALNPADDRDLATQRNAWLLERIESPETKPAETRAKP